METLPFPFEKNSGYAPGMCSLEYCLPGVLLHCKDCRKFQCDMRYFLIYAKKIQDIYVLVVRLRALWRALANCACTRRKHFCSHNKFFVSTKCICFFEDDQLSGLNNSIVLLRSYRVTSDECYTLVQHYTL